MTGTRAAALRVGLTGGIASGKSTVAKLFGELGADVGRCLAAPDRAAHLVDLARESQRVAGRDDPLEPAVVDPREEGDPAAVLLLAEHRNGPGLGHRLDDQDAGHHRPLGKVPREPPAVLGDAVEGGDARAGLELGHLVQQQERVTVREDRRNRVPPEGRAGGHGASVLGPVALSGGAAPTGSPQRPARRRRAS